jgi:hypothetical protein
MQFVHDARDVRLDCILRQIQLAGDDFVRETAQQHRQDLSLTFCKRDVTPARYGAYFSRDLARDHDWLKIK